MRQSKNGRHENAGGKKELLLAFFIVAFSSESGS